MRANPSLQPELLNALLEAYEDAAFGAMRETGLPLATFLQSCPYPLDRVMDQGWLPAKV